jgi:peptidyl-tRNA hydrolase, PTH2 family
MDKNIKQVIIIRKDLNMRKGKMIAQGAHASIGVIFNYMSPNYMNPDHEKNHFEIHVPEGEVGDDIRDWMMGMFKKIVVGSETLIEMIEAYHKAKTAGLPCSLIEDKGLTEFGGEITITAVAIGPARSEKIDPITSKFSLL